MQRRNLARRFRRRLSLTDDTNSSASGAWRAVSPYLRMQVEPHVLCVCLSLGCIAVSAGVSPI